MEIKYVYFVYWCWVMQPRYDVKMYLDSHKPINAEWPSLNSNKTITHGHCKTLDILNRLNEKNIPSFIRLLAVKYMTGVEN
jgi:hypothetical protein